MSLKINIKARLQRHARNSHALNKKHIFTLLKKFKLFSVFIILILPVYPSFGAYGLNEETAVGNYDNSTIITAYEGDTEDSSIFSKESGFIKPNSTLDDTRDIAGMSKLISYVVADGDSLGAIAKKFNVSVNSIIWANNFGSDTILHPKDTIKIPPVSGLVYIISSGDTIQSLASKYKVDAKKITEQNKFALKQELLIGQQIIIPGAIKINPPKVIPVIAKKNDGKKKILTKNIKRETKTYAVGYTGKGNRFVWGNCTYFVANHKNVTWRGNAKDWLRNAAAAGVPTGDNPVP